MRRGERMSFNCLHGLEGVQCQCAEALLHSERTNHVRPLAETPIAGRGVAFYPANDWELGVSMTCALLEESITVAKRKVA